MIRDQKVVRVWLSSEMNQMDAVQSVVDDWALKGYFLASLQISIDSAGDRDAWFVFKEQPPERQYGNTPL